MNSKTRLFIISLTFFLLSACSLSNQGEVGENEKEIPFSFISENFRYGGFDYPVEWGVTEVSSNVQLAYRDAENPENHRYSDTPFRYNFTFGRRAESNEIPKKKLEKYNQTQKLNEQTHRQHFYHTYDDYYAELSISSNGFLHVLVHFDNVEQWEISDTIVKVLRQENEWRANWRLNGAYYDLHVGNKAQIKDVGEFKKLLKLMIGS